jgi:ornithine cyclodeaminase/alanine dehydrogenase-like protein (mu-crystallin family)
MLQEITVHYFSQEDLLLAGCFDIKMAMEAAEQAMRFYKAGEILFPDKIVQIFDEQTQERINCLPATILPEKICGMKWVSAFPPNPIRYGVQNLSAVFILSEIEKGFPIAFMEGTLCSNMRVGAIGGLAAKYLAREDARTIGFIGSGEQAKMHLIAMKSIRPGIEACRISAKTAAEEEQFISQMQPIMPDLQFVAAGTDHQAAMDGADILVTATSAQAPLLKAPWMKPGAFYSHIGGWEDEYAVARQCDKIVCDDWETAKHRTQTLSRMYREGNLKDRDIYANLPDLVVGGKPGRQSHAERIYFNAVGLAYVDVAIALAMYKRARQAEVGKRLTLQESTIFQHEKLAEWIRI